jgi:riboflavin biosynthesis pyrimidine reductase
MDVQGEPDSRPASEEPLRLKRLLPAGDPATILEIIEELGLWNRPTSPAAPARLILNMVSTADGRATLGGRSGSISDAADRALFHGLRLAVDAVLVGAGTVRSERYGRVIADASGRRMRRARGLPEEPLACIVSGRLALGEDIPLLDEPSARVAILTASAASLPASRAQIDYVRAGVGGVLDLAAALLELGERFDVHTVLCEGGPHLGYQLLAAGLLDELFLTLSPTLAGGEPSGGEALRILAGGELEPPVALELLGALQSDSYLFLRYGVSVRERVSRETTLSSSLAR